MRIVQLLGEGVEELWKFPHDVSDELIKSLYLEYEENTFEHNEDSFEDFMKNRHWEIDCERIFVDEVYV